MKLFNKKQKYVCGFAFNSDSTKILLINKDKPEWQKGYLNGIGGKIEKFDKDIYHAMAREFKEEIGLLNLIYFWNLFHKLESLNSIVYFFERKFDDITFNAICNMSEINNKTTNEKVGCYFTDSIGNNQVVENLKWLIPMSKDKNHKYSESKNN